MADQDDSNPETARARLLELLEGGDWGITMRARREGSVVLRWLFNREPTDEEMVDYVISLLKTKTVIRYAPQDGSPGSRDFAWQMTDAKNIFVKLKISDGFGQQIPREHAFIVSIHESIHPK